MAPPLSCSWCFAVVYSKSFQLEVLSLLFQFSCLVVAVKIIFSFLESLTGLPINTGCRLVLLKYSELVYSEDYRNKCDAVTH